ncbi:MAG: hypothetical protein GF388_00010 [Candidatus Aegiribacteria sp.]|nr:hypothetical protein [Candidatus Aegiribacteria sp.]MBD3293854.1 hypothetical protein [Candidatus Fermentibacteria bacterium]
MKKLKYFASLVLAASLLLVACGGGGEEAVGNGGTDGASGTTDPDELAQEIAERYLECMEELEAMVADRPEPERLRREMAELKEEYIRVFVEIGHRVATHDSDTVDEIGRAVMSELYGHDIQWLTDASNHYMSLDNEVANMLAEFNIITQYSFFELLREQNPEEAERLDLM